METWHCDWKCVVIFISKLQNVLIAPRTLGSWSSVGQTDRLNADCGLVVYFSIPCSHRRHRQDKLSGLVRIAGVNTTADNTRQFCLVWTQFRWVLSPDFHISKFSVILNRLYLRLNSYKLETWSSQNKTHASKLGRDKTKLSCLVASVFTPTTWTRQETFVLSVSAVSTS